jgi:SagB-type dehydrogenase family enzyme
LRAPKIKTRRERQAGSRTISARLSSHVTLDVQANGKIFACFSGYSVGLGSFSAGAAARAQDLRVGLPLASFVSGSRTVDHDIHQLVRRLARQGLLEFCLLQSRSGQDQIVIEPQVADYWPRTPPLAEADALILSRFAYLRRRGSEMVLESPLSGALFRICDPRIATAIARLSAPQQIKQLRRDDDFPGVELLALLVDCQILFKIDAAGKRGLRSAEGDDDLVRWDFHDLLFHARSTEGRHANPLGGTYPYADHTPPPAVRPLWPGKKIDLRKFPDAHAPEKSPIARLLRERHSIREFDDQRPISLAELAQFLERTARVLSTWDSKVDAGAGGASVGYAARPYPSAGASYELELYLAVDKCEGLARGFYHYDAGGHALMAIGARPHELDALLTSAQFAMDAPGTPQILITIAARFGRVSWKYSSIAYALILKDVGVLLQTFYTMATDMGLGGCAIGTVNVNLFAQMTGLELHVEGPIGQFAIGRATKLTAAD